MTIVYFLVYLFKAVRPFKIPKVTNIQISTNILIFVYSRRLIVDIGRLVIISKSVTFMRLLNFLKNYLKETRFELQKVSWPTRQEAVRYLVIILVFSGIMAAFLGLFDFAFLRIVEQIIIK